MDARSYAHGRVVPLRTRAIVRKHGRPSRRSGPGLTERPAMRARPHARVRAWVAPRPFGPGSRARPPRTQATSRSTSRALRPNALANLGIARLAPSGQAYRELTPGRSRG